MHACICTVRNSGSTAEQHNAIRAHAALSAARIVGSCWLKMLRPERSAAAAAAAAARTLVLCGASN